VKIISRGRVCSIILLDNDNKIFAICYASEDSAVERTLDSGRYFVLRITNPQGRHAFIGIAFNERNDAFDFNVALSEFKNEIEREDHANKLTNELSTSIVQPLKDMSLKQGEKIKIKLSNKKKISDNNPDDNLTSIGNKSTLLLPPPRQVGNSVLTLASTNNTIVSTTSATISGCSNVTNSQPSFNVDPFNSDPFSISDTTTFNNSSNNTKLNNNSSSVFSFGSSSSTMSSDPFAATSDPFASNNDPFSTTITTTYKTNNSKESSNITSSPNLLDF